MSELTATAERLRVVKDARLEFITLWALDQLMTEDRQAERIYGDVLSAAELNEAGQFSTLYSAADWTIDR
jgi:hypothetical protein